MNGGWRQFLFVSFEASSLSSESWPIEVGIARLYGDRVMQASCLIRPRKAWPWDDWSFERQRLHGIRLKALRSARPAAEVADWLERELVGRKLVCGNAFFDQWWLDQLVGALSPHILEFEQAADWAFGAKGVLVPNRLSCVQRSLSRQAMRYRVGEDAARLCRAWRAGLLGDNGVLRSGNQPTELPPSLKAAPQKTRAEI